MAGLRGRLCFFFFARAVTSASRKKIADCRVGERTDASAPSFSGFDEVFVSIFLPYPSLFLSLFLVAVAPR
jgi:hypothetical protein